MNSKKLSIFALHFISVVCMVCGWFMPILTISAGMDAPFLGRMEIIHETRSILTTIENLVKNDNYLPAILIVFFGLIIPLAKVIIVSLTLFNPIKFNHLNRMVLKINKWAMADVFAISIMISFLMGNALEHTTAQIEPGFYLFTAYVILAGVVSSMLYSRVNSAESI